MHKSVLLLQLINNRRRISTKSSEYTVSCAPRRALNGCEARTCWACASEAGKLLPFIMWLAAMHTRVREPPLYRDSKQRHNRY